MSLAAPLRVLIVDDEPLARQWLVTLVNECPQPRCMVVAQCADAEQARQALVREPADVALLDVQMPGDTGLALAAQWQRLPRPPVVVFVTAFGEHAMKAFEVEAADYLTKPVRRERLFEALTRAAKRVVAAPAAIDGDEASALVVTERGRLIRVPLREVLYLKAELKYVTLRTAERNYLLDDALLDLEQRLGERFLRVHRNALVARAAVRLLEKRRLEGEEDAGDSGEPGWAVCVAPVNEWLAVSRRQISAVREALEKP
jgi:two-component system, LytTR family, response regulator AlgR